jgi:hypothetical protein
MRPSVLLLCQHAWDMRAPTCHLLTGCSRSPVSRSGPRYVAVRGCGGMGGVVDLKSQPRRAGGAAAEGVRGPGDTSTTADAILPIRRAPNP